MSTAQSAALTKGHSASNPGLRGHSVGPTYPYVVAAKGRIDALDWVAMDLRTGNTSRSCRSYKEAEIEMFSLLVRNMMHS